MKLITRITDSLSIHGDEQQYVLRVGTRYHYHVNLSGAFEEAYEELLRSRLADGKHKDMKAVLRIVESTRDDIRSVLSVSDSLNADKADT